MSDDVSFSTFSTFHFKRSMPGTHVPGTHARDGACMRRACTCRACAHMLGMHGPDTHAPGMHRPGTHAHHNTHITHHHTHHIPPHTSHITHHHTQWFRALYRRPDGPGFESRFGSLAIPFTPLCQCLSEETCM